MTQLLPLGKVAYIRQWEKLSCRVIASSLKRYNVTAIVLSLKASSEFQYLGQLAQALGLKKQCRRLDSGWSLSSETLPSSQSFRAQAAARAQMSTLLFSAPQVILPKTAQLTDGECVRYRGEKNSDLPKLLVQ